MSNSARASRSEGSWLAAMGIAVLVLATAQPAVAQSLIPDLPDAAGNASAHASVGSSDWSFNRIERCFMRKVNDKRAQFGLQRLEWDKQVGWVSRRHAYAMASTGSVWHDDQLGAKITNWSMLGQNSGRGAQGGHCGGLFRAFWRSGPHRANILGSWRYMGIGGTRHYDRLYVQMAFESRVNPGNIYSRP